MDSNLIARWKTVFADFDAARAAITRIDNELAHIATEELFDKVAFRFDKVRTELASIDALLAGARLANGSYEGKLDDSFDAKFKVAIEAWVENNLYHHVSTLGFLHDSEIGSILRDSRPELRNQGVVFRETLHDDVVDLCNVATEDYVTGAISDAFEERDLITSDDVVSAVADAFDEREFIDSDDVNNMIEAAFEEHDLVTSNDVQRMIRDDIDEFRDSIKHSLDGVRVAFMRMSEDI